MARVATFNLNNLISRWSFQTELPEQARVAASRTDPETPVLHADVPSAVAGLAAAGGRAGPPTPQAVDVTLADGTVLTGVLRTYLGRLVKGKKPADREWLAARIKALNADVLCAREVEDQDALEAFCREDLEAVGVSYPYRCVVEGNDPRRIDVAVLSRLPLRRISSWSSGPTRPGTARSFPVTCCRSKSSPADVRCSCSSTI